MGANISKLIFLDIDGVFNNGESDVKNLHVLEYDLLIRFKRFLENDPNVAIVLSSSWRYKEKERLKVREGFKDAGIPPYISCTRNLGTNRVDEILCWMIDNTDFNVDGWKDIIIPTRESLFPEDLPENEYMLGNMLKNITHFIAIDDMDLNKEKSNNIKFITPRFVHVNKKLGLQDVDIKNAIELLK